MNFMSMTSAENFTVVCLYCVGSAPILIKPILSAFTMLAFTVNSYIVLASGDPVLTLSFCKFFAYRNAQLASFFLPALLHLPFCSFLDCGGSLSSISSNTRNFIFFFSVLVNLDALLSVLTATLIVEQWLITYISNKSELTLVKKTPFLFLPLYISIPSVLN